MIIVNDDARIVDANSEAANIYGVDHQKLLGRTFREFHPEEFDFGRQELQNSETKRDTVSIVGDDEIERFVEYSVTTDIVPGQHLVVSRDITEQEERKNALRETTSRLEALFEKSPDMIDVLDAEGTILDVNSRFCEELGYDEDDVLELPIWEIDQLVDADDVRTLISNVALDERRKFEGRYECHDGSTIPVEVHLLRLHLDGKDRFLAISRDITERKERERALEETTRRLETVIDVSPDPIVAVAADGTIQLWNDAAEELFGYPAAAVVGEEIRSLGLYERPAFEEQFRRVLTGETLDNHEVQRQTKDGDTIHLSISMAPLRDTSGTVTGAMAVVTEITEHVETPQ